MNEDIINEFAGIFCKCLRMLQEEVEENKENVNTFNDINNLIKEWNNLYDKYINE